MARKDVAIRSSLYTRLSSAECVRKLDRVLFRTSRSSAGGCCFRSVRGVLPRSFPGVFISSAISLLPDTDVSYTSLGQDSGVNSVHCVSLENVRHVLVEPFQIVPGRICKFLEILSFHLADSFELVRNPGCRSDRDGSTGEWTGAARHGGGCCCGQGKTKQTRCCSDDEVDLLAVSDAS